MSIESDIYTALTGYAPLTALVGTKIYAVRLPQAPSYPNILYRRINTDFNMTLDGPNALRNPTFQFDVRATTFDAVLSIIDAVEDAMLAAGTFSVSIDNRVDMDFEDPIGTFRSVIDFSVWYCKT